MARTTKATGTFKIASWDEGPYAEHDGAPKLTLARVTSSYSGDVEGEGTGQSVMRYHGAQAEYLGFERLVGRVGERSGSFVLRIEGVWQDGVARTTWSVAPGSGTGDLEGLRGEGGYGAGANQSEVAYTLDYHFD